MGKRKTAYNKVLKEYFGYDELKEEQFKIIDKIVHYERDVCGVLATGFGKSLCYQLPFLLTKKTVFVVSPLIALMDDQKAELENLNIPVCCLHSNNHQKGNEIENLLDGANKIVYITPESLVNYKDVIQTMAEENNICMFAIDESHCISSWGLDFRPDYAKLSCLKKWTIDYGIPILALTATATLKVRNDICDILNLDDPYRIVGGFDRPNLYIHVQKKINFEEDLTELLNTHKDDYIIIYCQSKRETDEVAIKVAQLGIKCKPYHGGMDADKRALNQSEFIKGDIKCMVATIAFGMGINKSAIRLVVHYNCPKNLDSYYQEIGRAGRDGKPSNCYLFYGAKDFRISSLFIKDIQNSAERNHHEFQLQMIIKYVNTSNCRRKFILQHFDDNISTLECNNCNNCINVEKKTDRDFTKESHILFNLLTKINGKFGSTLIVNILRGSNSKKITNDMKKFDEYNKGKLYSDKWWKESMGLLTNHGYLFNKNLKSGFGSVVELTKKGFNSLKNNEKVNIPVNDEFLKLDPVHNMISQYAELMS
jgi:RecQ family ATP-dependent DNA helicase